MTNKFLKSGLKFSSIFFFNQANRDSWIKRQAALIPAGSVVLDAGAGSCPYRDFFSHCEYSTQDFTNLQGEQLSGGQYGEIDYVCDISSIPLGNGSFDVVLCSEVLEHVADPAAVVQEFARILKPGGKLMLTAPLGSGIHQAPYHYYGGYTPFWYEKYLAKAGFDHISIKSNAGSLQACAQESMRFIQLSRPFKLGMPLWAELLWLPIWLMLLPFMAILAPLYSYMLRSYDKNRNFTVGYHIIAYLAGAVIEV